MLMMSINAMMSVLFFLFLTKKSLRKHCRQSEPDGADVLVVVGCISRDSANTVGDIYCGVTFPKAICSRAFFKGKRSLLGIIPPSIGGSCNMSCTSSKLQVTKILLFDPFTPVCAVLSRAWVITVTPAPGKLKFRQLYSQHTVSMRALTWQVGVSQWD